MTLRSALAVAAGLAVAVVLLNFGLWCWVVASYGYVPNNETVLSNPDPPIGSVRAIGRVLCLVAPLVVGGCVAGLAAGKRRALHGAISGLAVAVLFLATGLTYDPVESLALVGSAALCAGIGGALAELAARAVRGRRTRVSGG